MKKAEREKRRAQEAKAWETALAQLRPKYPDVYMVPGLGWCGPGWEYFAVEECAILRS